MERREGKAKLSERLFNEPHFSDPSPFDAKYLARWRRSFLKDALANLTGRNGSQYLKKLDVKSIRIFVKNF